MHSLGAAVSFIRPDGTFNLTIFESLALNYVIIFDASVKQTKLEDLFLLNLHVYGVGDVSLKFILKWTKDVVGSYG